jgi:hypothetical protein
MNMKNNKDGYIFNICISNNSTPHNGTSRKSWQIKVTKSHIRQAVTLTQSKNPMFQRHPILETETVSETFTPY